MEPNASNQFIFIKAEIREEERRTGRGGGGIYRPYVPSEQDASWTSMEIADQISSTISTYEKKSIKDEEEIFIVLGLSKKHSVNDKGELREKYTIFTSDFWSVINRLSAEVLTYLNQDHDRILIKCPVSKLIDFQEKERYNNQYFIPVIRIGPLLKNEQIAYSLISDEEWEDEKKPVLLQLMPNIENEKRNEYYHKLLSELNKEDVDIIDLLDNGVLYLNINKNMAEDLLEKSDFIFKIENIPTGFIENYHTLDRFVQGGSEGSDLEDIQPTNPNSLPEICILDSGVNDIPPLSGLISVRECYFRFYDNNDDGVDPYGHGTPIACLASLSETLRNPAARIISYKVYSDAQRNWALHGIRNGITKYSERTRLFLSSIVFEYPNPIATTLLDRMIQNYNICFIMSAGNIEKSTIFENIRGGIGYPRYNLNYSVSDPAQAHSIFAVGAISKSSSDNTIAPADELAPFSRCGHQHPSLFQCTKPEVVQNGGNVCVDETIFGCLNSFDKNGTDRDSFIGTSFAAPLVARRMVEIERLYGDKIRNAETFKAISIASTSKQVKDCVGYGETCYITQCGRENAFIINEGTLKLPYKIRPYTKLETYSDIKIDVPDSVKSIEMIIVHSDNGSRMSEPSLNTYLKVRARKQGRPSSYVPSLNPHENDKKTHIKYYKWEFKRKSMESEWTFIIKPDVTAEMLDEHKREITIRYGCVIILNTKPSYRGTSLTRDIINLNGNLIL